MTQVFHLPPREIRELRLIEFDMYAKAIDAIPKDRG